MPKYGESGAKGMGGTPTFQVSLLRCRKTGRVLFLEAGKDFVDTLFSFLLLPVGTIIHILSNAAGAEVKVLGGISSIYESIEKLDSSFMHADKKKFVQPRPAVAGACGSVGLLKGLEAATINRPSQETLKMPEVYYHCSNSYNACSMISSAQGNQCQDCKKNYYGNYTFNRAMTVLPKNLQELKMDIVGQIVYEMDRVEEGACSTGQGFVKENITYMVTDNLEVEPSTTIRSIKVLNRLKVATLADLESTDITVTITQILQLLQSAMTSNSCLNDVFFGKK